MAKQPQREITTFYYTRMVKLLSICCSRNVNERPPMPLALQIPDIFQFILCTEKGQYRNDLPNKRKRDIVKCRQPTTGLFLFLSFVSIAKTRYFCLIFCIHSRLIFPLAIYSIVTDLQQTIYLKNNSYF